MFGRCFIGVLLLSCSIAAHAQDGSCSAVAGSTTGKPGSTIVITATNAAPATTTNVSNVTVDCVNIFRYDVVPQVQTTISNPAAPPGGMFSAGSGAAVSSAPTPTRMGAGFAPQQRTPAEIFSSLRERADDEVSELNNLTTQTNALLTSSANEQACFNDILRRYPRVLLTPAQKNALLKELEPVAGHPKNAGDFDRSAGAAPTCLTNSAGMFVWPYAGIKYAIQSALTLSGDIVEFQVSDGYVEWIKTDTDARKDAFNKLVAENTATQASLQALLNSPNIATLNASAAFVQMWRARAVTASAKDANWDISFPLTCHAQWFGRTEGQVVSLHYLDLSLTTLTDQTLPLFTNACLPTLTVSTGLGISTVRSSTYAFTPQTTGTTTMQVIGYATDSQVLPVYVGQMNYGFAHWKSVGFHGSGGVGVGSSSAGTTGDFFAGPAFSFARRAIFVTPSLHLTQRQTLQDGYKVGEPQGMLTSVPTINRWRYGFAITFTLPVLQTP